MSFATERQTFILRHSLKLPFLWRIGLTFLSGFFSHLASLVLMSWLSADIRTRWGLNLDSPSSDVLGSLGFGLLLLTIADQIPLPKYCLPVIFMDLIETRSHDFARLKDQSILPWSLLTSLLWTDRLTDRSSPPSHQLWQTSLMFACCF